MEKVFFNNIRKNILGEILKAEHTIKVGVCWFTNHELFDALCSKIEDGVKVELIVINDYINNRTDGLNFQKFIDIGGDFYFGDNEKPMHNKYCIIDDKILINGSYNWTYYSENKNEENIIIHAGKKNLLLNFIKDFERIKSGLPKVKSLSQIAITEINNKNYFGAENYLALDYLYESRETKMPSIVEKALQLAPNNFQIQKEAVALNILTKRKTITNIGREIIEDGFVILIPKGTVIPIEGENTFHTVEDNQTETSVDIRYGIYENASGNKLIGSFNISGIPEMPAGKAGLITKYKIDIKGKLTVTEIIEETVNSVTMDYNVSHLLTNK
ncbi:MAG: Hsp70 family protein [Bacteroidetes bacterium]|nr:Hsp70 family protein [Bacteroidota bacterium]